MPFDYGLIMRNGVVDKFSEEFINIVLKHVETIPEDNYKQFTQLSEHGESVYPIVMLGVDLHVVRQEEN